MTIVRILVAYLNETYSFPENISKKKEKIFFYLNKLSKQTLFVFITE